PAYLGFTQGYFLNRLHDKYSIDGTRLIEQANSSGVIALGGAFSISPPRAGIYTAVGPPMTLDEPLGEVLASHTFIRRDTQHFVQVTAARTAYMDPVNVQPFTAQEIFGAKDPDTGKLLSLARPVNVGAGIIADFE